MKKDSEKIEQKNNSSTTQINDFRNELIRFISRLTPKKYRLFKSHASNFKRDFLFYFVFIFSKVSIKTNKRQERQRVKRSPLKLSAIGNVED